LRLDRGFTLVEVLVATAIIALLSTALLFNFGTAARNKTARTQTASVIVSDIRRAQSMALAGTRFGGNVVCGYGVRYVNKTAYLLYAGSKEGLPRCQDTNHNYQAGIDLMVEEKKLFNPKMEIRSPFPDIFFESPDPRTYINNSAVLTDPPATITIQLIDQANCAQQSCAQIEVFTSGRIDLN